MAKVKMVNVLLERKWSGHEAGEIVTVEEYTAKSMLKKNYGRITITDERKKVEFDKPQVETADEPIAAEKAVMTPEIDNKAKSKAESEAKAKADKKKK